MSLISLQQAQLAYGHVALLDHVDFSLETQERVGLIGRNGTGKSSMLRILAGQESPDDGSLQCQHGLRRDASHAGIASCHRLATLDLPGCAAWMTCPCRCGQSDRHALVFQGRSRRGREVPHGRRPVGLAVRRSMT